MDMLGLVKERICQSLFIYPFLISVHMAAFRRKSRNFKFPLKVLEKALFPCQSESTEILSNNLSSQLKCTIYLLCRNTPGADEQSTSQSNGYDAGFFFFQWQLCHKSPKINFVFQADLEFRHQQIYWKPSVWTYHFCIYLEQAQFSCKHFLLQITQIKMAGKIY